jgi:hypothetical protein
LSKEEPDREAPEPTEEGDLTRQLVEIVGPSPG